MSEEDEVGEGSTSMVISSVAAEDDEGSAISLLPSAAIVFPLVADLLDTSALPFVIIPSADRETEKGHTYSYVIVQCISVIVSVVGPAKS